MFSEDFVILYALLDFIDDRFRYVPTIKNQSTIEV